MKRQLKKAGRGKHARQRQDAPGDGQVEVMPLVAGPSIDVCYGRIREILGGARASLARSVNTTQVVACWLVGREIVHEELNGQTRADYGTRLLTELAARMTADFGRGYSARNLRYLRQFYVEYPRLVDEADIWHALRAKFAWHAEVGRLNPNLSWTHYRALLTLNIPTTRAFYEIEAVKNNWSARELERQINTHLYDRLAQSRDKEGTMRLALQGQEVQRPADVFKDPIIMEFAGIPSPPALTEAEVRRELRFLQPTQGASEPDAAEAIPADASGAVKEEAATYQNPVQPIWVQEGPRSGGWPRPVGD